MTNQIDGIDTPRRHSEAIGRRIYGLRSFAALRMTPNRSLLACWFIVFLFILSFFNTGVCAEEQSSPAKTGGTLNLMECYKLALKRSESLAISKEEIERSEASFFQATSEVLGNVSFVATSFKQDARAESSESGSSVGSTLTAREKTESKIVISQPLFQGFKSLGALTGAGHLRSQRQEEWIRAKHLLFIDVARSYYRVLKDQKDLHIIQEMKKLYNERVSDLTEREKIGRSRPSELATANAGLKNIEAELAKAMGIFNVEENILEFLIGIPVDNIALQDHTMPDEIATVDRFLAQLGLRPDVEASKNAMKLAQKNLIVVQSNLWPVLSLDFNRYTERDGFQSDIDWDALLKIDVPLFRGTETLGKIKDAVSQWKQAKLRYVKTQREAELDIKQTYQDWLTSQEQYKALRDSVYAQEENFRLQKEDYTRNLVNNLDVLQSLENLYQATRLANEVYYESKLNYWRLQVSSGQCCSEPS